MDGLYAQNLEKQKRMGELAKEHRLVRISYALDEAAYALSEQIALAGGKNLFPPSSAFDFLLTDFTFEERSFFICRLLKHLQKREKDLTAADLLFPEERASQGEHIVYVRNYYTERAYELFASSLAAPTVSYASDFTDACAEVGEGLADLCILPFRDEAWGSFHSFSKMPEHYGLCVRAVCTVARAEGETMRLSLCGRGCLVPNGAKKVAVEMLFPSDDDGEDFESIRRLLRYLDGQTLFAEALPDRYTAKTSWHVTYVLAHADLEALLLGKRIFAPKSELLGIYAAPTLSENEA